MSKILNQVELAQFTGTDVWYKHWTGWPLYTQGVQYIAENAGAYWLLDIIATELKSYVAKQPFMVLNLKVENSAAKLIVEDGNGHDFYKREIEYTDFPEGNWNMYLTKDVLLLPSEY